MHRLQLLDGESPFCVAVTSAYMVKARMHVVMQWAEYGTLYSLLDRETEQVSESSAKVMAWSLLVGLDYCHARGIAHLDVKAENALLVKRLPAHERVAAASDFLFPPDAAPYVAVLCDFGEAVELPASGDDKAAKRPPDVTTPPAAAVGAPGISEASSREASANSRSSSTRSSLRRKPSTPSSSPRCSRSSSGRSAPQSTGANQGAQSPHPIANGNSATTSGEASPGYASFREPLHTALAGSLDYVAPEILLKAYRPREADMWSMGVTLFLMLTNQLPFMAATRELTEHRILNQREPLPPAVLPRVSEAGASLLLHLLRRDPTKRLRAADAVRHPWICAKPGEGAAQLACIPTGLDIPFTCEAALETEV
jgi:serine/threonine protein kinase